MRHPLLVILLLAVAGCAAIANDSRETKFDATLRLYTRTIEWSNFEGLGMFIKVDQDNPAPDPGRYKDIKITGYQPGRGQGSADGKTFTRAARIHYVLTSRMSEKQLNLVEVWVYSDEDGRWYLKSGLPRF
jgi:hypothetical protein